MGLDFWGVRLKKNVDIKNQNHIFKEVKYYHPEIMKYITGYEVNEHIFDDSELINYMDDELKAFEDKMNDEDWWHFCKDTVGFFPSGDPICTSSEEDRDKLADKLNEFIKANPNFEYTYGYDTHYSNEEIRLFIKYVNLVKEHDFIWWLSW